MLGRRLGFFNLFPMVFHGVPMCFSVLPCWGNMGWQWADGICLVVFPPRRLAAAPPSPASPTAEWPPPWRTAAASAGAISPSWQQGRPMTSAGATGRPRAVCCWAGAACGLDGHDELKKKRLLLIWGSEVVNASALGLKLGVRIWSGFKVLRVELAK